MPYSKRMKRHHRKTIKWLLVLNPELRFCPWRVKTELENLSNPIKLHQDTIKKILDEINCEFDEGLKQETVQEHAKNFLFRAGEAERRMWVDATSTKVSTETRAIALREARSTFKDSYNIRVACGLLKQETEKVEPERTVIMQGSVDPKKKIRGILREMLSLGHISEQEILQDICETRGTRVIGQLGKGDSPESTEATEKGDSSDDAV